MEAKVFNNTYWVSETRPLNLLKSIELLLKKADFIVLGFIEHHFEPEGYTAIWLLAESHLAVHTFPEKQKTYIELSSCNRHKHGVFDSQLNNNLIVVS
jgi:S-adenosylmethionine decarboxylase